MYGVELVLGVLGVVASIATANMQTRATPIGYRMCTLAMGIGSAWLAWPFR